MVVLLHFKDGETEAQKVSLVRNWTIYFRTFKSPVNRANVLTGNAGLLEVYKHRFRVFSVEALRKTHLTNQPVSRRGDEGTRRGLPFSPLSSSAPPVSQRPRAPREAKGACATKDAARHRLVLSGASRLPRPPRWPLTRTPNDPREVENCQLQMTPSSFPGGHSEDACS